MRLGGSSKFVGVASVSFCFAFRFVSRFTSTQTYVASIIKVFYVLVNVRLRVYYGSPCAVLRSISATPLMQ